MAKSHGRIVTSKPARVKTAVVISPEAFQRLGAACLKEGMTQSEIVEQLINRALSGYVVSVRGQGFRAASVAPEYRAGDATDVNLADRDAAA
jgi:hypothetical protein